jgi:Fe-S cluster assembly protein SufD
MTNIKSLDDLNEVFVEDLAETLALRQKHFNEIETMSYPVRGKINISKMNLLDLSVDFKKENKLTELTPDLKALVEDESNVIVMKDGSIVYRNLSHAFDGIIITSYNEAIASGDKLVINHFLTDLQASGENKLMTANKAFRNSALLIYVPKNVVVKETLKIHIIGSKDLVHFTCLEANQSSELTILERIDSLSDINVNFYSNARIMENAKVNYIGIDRLSEGSKGFIERRAAVYADASLVYALGQLNECSTVSNNIVKLLGKNAHCESRNVLFADRQNTYAVTVDIEHLAPYSVGNIINHGIVNGNGHLYIDGIGKINQGMNASNAQQHTKVIILSDDAKVDANPYLLIDEYDVMAGHGAAIGRVDEEQLYYLMSRGLSKKEAEKLIVLGFLFPIIEMIDSDIIKDDFIKTIEKKLSI